MRKAVFCDVPEERECVRDMRHSIGCRDSRGRSVSFGLSCVRAVRIAYSNRRAYAVMTEVQECEDSCCKGSEVPCRDTEENVWNKIEVPGVRKAAWLFATSGFN